MEEKVKISLVGIEDKSYDIVITDKYSRIPVFLKETGDFDGFCIITDKNVNRFHGNKFIYSIRSKIGIRTELLSILPGERSKTLTEAGNLCEKMLKKGFTRKSCVISFGGGVVGDLAGFTAGIFMRGIPFVQVPTTLLACVDSSVGGKTGVDLLIAKNSCGIFHQPKIVLIYPQFLLTLPLEEFCNGLFESIKHGLIKDAKYFDFIMKNIKKILSKDISTLIHLIKWSCSIKAEIVSKDEKEKGLRRILNFGHTIGHAIEVVSDFKMGHGMAVGFGMLAEAKIGNLCGITPNSVVKTIEDSLKILNISKTNFKTDSLIDAMIKDKKNFRTKENEIRISFVFPLDIGKVKVYDFSVAEVKEFLKKIA